MITYKITLSRKWNFGDTANFMRNKVFILIWKVHIICNILLCRESWLLIDFCLDGSKILLILIKTFSSKFTIMEFDWMPCPFLCCYVSAFTCVYYNMMLVSTFYLLHSFCYLFVIDSQQFCQVSDMLRHASITSVAGLLSNLRSHGTYLILLSLDLLWTLSNLIRSLSISLAIC